MQLRDALDDFKRHEGHPTRFPGERRTTTGRFSGADGRLVHVDPDGRLRDFGYPLTGLTGLERSRFGLRTPDGELLWSDEFDSEQRYVDGTTLVETVHATPLGTLTRYDLTLNDAHLSRFEFDADDGVAPEEVAVVVYAAFAPDGRDDRVGQLRLSDAVEVYHADEHDFLASATGFGDLRGQLPATPSEVLAAEPLDLPRDRDGDRYEEDRLSGEILVTAPLETDGDAAAGTHATTVATLLTDEAETDRDEAVAALDRLFAERASLPDLRAAAADRTPTTPADVPAPDAVTADLRVLSLLSAETGLRIAGPDFDPYYRHSGGYGYTWFRDDAEISRFLLEADERFDLGLDDWHRRSARMYCATQRSDGSWPHRVWPRDGSIAPGWANARIEAGDDVDYQADQTGSVIAFLASLRGEGVDVDGLDETLRLALDGLDETLADDGRPVVCQNAWEDASGRFTHTTATFLEAYSALAGTGLGSGAGATDAAAPADHAAEQAERVYDALDDLWVSDAEPREPSVGEVRAAESGATGPVERVADEEATGGHYAVRERPDGTVDDRLDSATLALAGAHRAYDRAAGTPRVDDERLDRLVSHVRTVVDGLEHDPADSDVRGVVRYEGDEWRRRQQDGEKIWTVSTAWAANACAELAALLDAHDDPRAEAFAADARDLLALVSPDGPLCADTTYLPEQFFDDGTPDSATPLGWPHALRLATVSLMDEQDTLAAAARPADD